MKKTSNKPTICVHVTDILWDFRVYVDCTFACDYDYWNRCISTARKHWVLCESIHWCLVRAFTMMGRSGIFFFFLINLCLLVWHKMYDKWFVLMTPYVLGRHRPRSWKHHGSECHYSYRWGCKFCFLKTKISYCE